MPHLCEHLGHPKDRLGGEAGLVEAAPADVALLDHRRLEPELGSPDRADVAAGPGTDHDAVVAGLGHGARQTSGAYPPGSLRPEGRTLQVPLDREVRGPRGLDLRDPQVADQPRVEAGPRDRSTPVVDIDPRDPRAVPLREVEHPLDGRVLTR